MAAAGHGRPFAAMMGAGPTNALQCAAGPAEGSRGKRRDARTAEVSGASGWFWCISVPFQRNFGAIRCCFSAILVLFQCHFGAFWRNFGAALVQFQCISVPFQCNFGTILVPFQYNFGLFQSHFSAFQCSIDATLVQFQCHFSAALMQIQCNFSVIQLVSMHFSAISVLFWCHFRAPTPLRDAPWDTNAVGCEDGSSKAAPIPHRDEFCPQNDVLLQTEVAKSCSRRRAHRLHAHPSRHSSCVSQMQNILKML